MQTVAMHPIVDKVFSYFEKYGHYHYVDNVSHLEHAIQTAELAEQHGADTEMILAALLHDIGHLLENEEDDAMGRFGGMEHECLGASFLKEIGLPLKMTTLVEHHVAAKRYLSFKQENYSNQLSEASRLSLNYQGGPMSKEEAHEFESLEWFDQKLQIRTWDDQAKIPGLQLSPLNKYKIMMQNLFNQMHCCN